MKILKQVWKYRTKIIVILISILLGYVTALALSQIPIIATSFKWLIVNSTLLGIIVCGFLFYLFNELEDKSMKSGWNKHRKFLNTDESWRNKWALDKHGRLISAEKKWYYFGVIPNHKERFYLSSTILVFLTDGEHLFQFLKMRFIELAILFLSWEAAIAWIIGKSIMSFIKEKFLNWLN